MKNLFQKLNETFFDFVFVISYFLLLIVLFFKSTNSLYFISIFLLLIYSLRYRNLIQHLIFTNRNLFMFLLLFLLCLLISIIYSPKPLTSLNKFIIYYLFCVVILISFSIFFYNLHPTSQSFTYLKISTIIANAILLLYLYLSALYYCNFKIKDTIIFIYGLQMFIDNNKIKLNGLLNISASFVYLIIICVYYFLISQSKKDKFLFYILFFFNFFTLILLARRSPLLGIFSGTLLSMLFYRYFNRKLFIISLSILITIFSITFHPDLKNTILVRGDTSENILKFKEKEVNNLSSVGFRLYEWERSVSILKENPFVGSGLGRKIMKERFFSESLIGHPHNTLISLALQSGIQTVITFLLFYFILFIKNLNLRKSPIKEIYYFSLLSFIFMISMFWIFMFAGVEEKIGFIPFWMMSGANLGVIIFSRDRYHKA